MTKIATDRVSVLADILGRLSEHRKSKGALITEDTNVLGDLALDSISSIELIMDLEDAYDIEIADPVAVKIVTVGDLVNVVTDLCKKSTGGA